MSGFPESYPLLLIIAVTALAVLVILIGILPRLFGSLYQRRYRLNEEKLADLEAETRSTMAQVAVGLAGFVVLWSAVESIKSTNRNLDLSTKNLELAKSTQLAERFSQAVDLLNQESPEASNTAGDAGSVARVGGVFALDRIVESDSAYQESTLHVLAAMVQRESPWSAVKAARGEQGEGVSSYRFRPCDWLDAHPEITPYLPGSDHETLAPDIAAALTVIGQLGTTPSSKIPDQPMGNGALALGANSRTEPPRADVSARLTRNIDLSQAKLCLAYVKDGRLVGTWFRHSDLRGAIFDDADLRNAGLVAVDLTGAHLTRANLADSSLKEASLNQADLSFADLSGADLFRAKLDDTNFSGAILQGTKNLTQEQLDQACGSSSTKLPDKLTIVDCSEKKDSMWIRN
jgi:hypothetical protein